MSVSRPVRCMFSASSSLSKATPAVQCRAFTVSAAAQKRRRFRSIKAEDMGLVSKEGNTDGLTTYTKEDTSKLAKLYTPEQLRVIEAGEEAVSIDDIKSHGVIRTDPYRLPYFDDLSVIRPVVDKRPKVAATAHPNARWMDEDEAVDAVNAWITKAEERNESDRPSDYVPAAGQEDKYGGLRSVDFARFIEEGELMVGGGHMGSSALAPALYSPDEVQEISKASTSQQVDDRDPEGKYDRLKRQTGMSLDEILRCRAKPLVRHRVVNQTRLGKIQSQYVLSIAGNGNGMLGIGEAKATEPDEAMDKANQAAIRNLKPIPRYENRTIFGDVEGKVSAVKVQLMARPPGFGLRCQHNIFEMARLAGIEDLAARVPHARNKMNTIKATFQALTNQRLPEEIAKGRGKKLVDVRKVYYGGDQEIPQTVEQKAAARRR